MVENTKIKFLFCSKLVYSCLIFASLHFISCTDNNSERAFNKLADSDVQNIRAFMDEELECEQYVFQPGDFPKFKWKNELRVETELGKFPLSVKYFNSNFQEVSKADKPGRYGAVIQGTTPAGFTIKRYITLFCSNAEFDDYSSNIPIKINPLPDFGIDDNKWDKYLKNVDHFSFGSLKLFPLHNADAAIFLSGLNDMLDLNNNFDTPRIRDRQWWITMKNKLDGNSIIADKLKLPQKSASKIYDEFNDSIVFSNDYDKNKIEILRHICLRWANEGRAAHVVVIVHRGKIIFHEAFGKDKEGNQISPGTEMWMASITKLLTGVLMMQFVEQGIIDLDSSVSKYLPEINNLNSDKLKVRDLFTHTSGLEFAGEWASDWNNSLENQISHVLPTVEIGKTFAYHRIGYALAGKIIERLTGRAVPYLFHDYIFSPLGMRTAYSDNTYGGLYCTATDLAHLGVMLLHKGTFNGLKFFSEQTFEDMLPKKLSVGERSWGIGISFKTGHGLSNSTFGHQAASGSIFCIDPKNELVIISARNKPGQNFDKFEKAFLETCTELVK